MTPLCFLVDGLSVCPSCVSRDEMAGADPVYDLGDVEAHEFSCVRCFERQCQQYASCDICDAEAAFPAVRALGALFRARRGAACGDHLWRVLVGACRVFGSWRCHPWQFRTVHLDTFHNFGASCVVVVDGDTSRGWRPILEARGGVASVLRALLECSPSVLLSFSYFGGLGGARCSWSPKYMRARRRFVRVIGAPHAHTILHELLFVDTSGALAKYRRSDRDGRWYPPRVCR